MAQMRVCFIGDSFVSGAYDRECLGWAGRISAAARGRGHDVSVYNLGIRGETCVQIARRWRTEAEARQSLQQEGRLVFEFGVNDVREVNGKRQLELAQSLAATRDMLAAAVRWKPTLMVGPPPGGDVAKNIRAAELADSIQAICAEHSVPYFDSFAPLLASPTFLTDVRSVDGTHPSAAGYTEWAKLIDAWPAWRAWLP